MSLIENFWIISDILFNSFAANVADRRRHSRLSTSLIGDLDVISDPVLIPSFTDILLSSGYFSFW